jgi:DNA/RNA-binding domain of Phe-tRNA-synthetase-like protein
MIEICIDSKMKKNHPATGLICLQCKVVNGPGNEILWKEINQLTEKIRKEISYEQIKLIPQICETRKAYKAFGAEPSRYRCSAEATYKRIVEGKNLYQINTVVDIINLLTLITRISIGCFDISKIKSPVIYRIGNPGEPYEAIGKTMNIENLPVLADPLGPFGCPTNDSKRSMITLESEDILITYNTFAPANSDEIIRLTIELLKKYAQAKAFEYAVH